MLVTIACAIAVAEVAFDGFEALGVDEVIFEAVEGGDDGVLDGGEVGLLFDAGVDEEEVGVGVVFVAALEDVVGLVFEEELFVERGVAAEGEGGDEVEGGGVAHVFGKGGDFVADRHPGQGGGKPGDVGFAFGGLGRFDGDLGGDGAFLPRAPILFDHGADLFGVEVAGEDEGDVFGAVEAVEELF